MGSGILTRLNMRVLVVLALLLAVAAADPWFVYGGYHGVPFGDPSGQDPITQGLDASTQGYHPYSHYYGHYYGKRSADADPWVVYAHHGVPFGHPSGQDPITQGLDASTQGYYPYSHYYGHHYGKRSADADPWVVYAHHGVPFGHPSGQDPITQGLDASTQGYTGHYYGLHHYYGKRSADPLVHLPYYYPYHSVVGHVLGTNQVLGHAVAETGYGLVHSSHVGVCTNDQGEQVVCA